MIIKRSGKSIENFIDIAQKRIAPYVVPFYRLYPYRGNIQIARADARGAISEYHQFFYNRIPKVANTTIINALVRYSTRDIFQEINAKKFFQRPASIDFNIALDLKEKYFKFAFVRNPYTRVLSAYLDKIVRVGSRRHSRRYHEWAVAKGASRMPSFADFCSYLDDGGLYEDAHWAPQLDCLLIPVSEFDFIGRLERLDADLQTVLDRVFPDQDVDLRNSGQPKTRAGDKVLAYYSDREIEIVNRLYAGDFQAFGYSTDLDDFRPASIFKLVQPSQLSIAARQ